MNGKHMDNTRETPENPFSGMEMASAKQGSDYPSMSGAELNDILEKARRKQRNQILLVVLFAMLVVDAACYYMYRTIAEAEQRMKEIQSWSAQSGNESYLAASNYLMHARSAANSASFAAAQARRDREAVVALNAEAATTVTNAAIELARQLSYALNRQGQSNAMQLDAHYIDRIRRLEAEIEKQQQALSTSVGESIRALNKELGKYDALLKLDPNVAGQIEGALLQLRQMVETSKQLKLKVEEDSKIVANQIALMTEKIKVLELRLNQLETALMQPPAPAPPSGTPPATPPLTPRPPG